MKPFKKRFNVFLLSLFLTCGAAVGLGLREVYRIAASFEHSSPEYVANGVLGWFEGGSYQNILSLAGLTLSPFEDEGRFAELMALSAPAGEYRLLRSGERSYLLLRGETELAELWLRPDEGAGKYGFDRWAAESLELICLSQREYTVMFPQQLAVSANGVRLTAELADHGAGERERGYIKSVFGDLPEEYLPYPTSVYVLTGLFGPPRLKAFGLEEEYYSIKQDGGAVTLLLTPTVGTVKQLSEFVVEAAAAYARFITNDADFADIKGYFLPQSPFYAHLAEFYNDWYNAHDRQSFDEPMISGWRMYDDYHLSCRLSFIHRVSMGERSFEYPSEYDIALVRTGDGWKVSNLVVA